MPLQDKSRPDRKVTARKIISSTGRIFDSIHDFAEEYDVTVQTAYNVIRRKQVFCGLTFRYLESEQKGVIQNGTKSNDER
jgi:hypothetical protein